MKKWILTATLFFSSITWADGYDYQTPEEIERARNKVERIFRDVVDPSSLTEEEKQKILEKYIHLDPKKWIKTDILQATILYFDLNKDKFPNKNYVAIIDFKLSSEKPRFFIVNLATGEVIRHYTTHGINSDWDDDGYAEKFSNTVNSWQSSLGYARTGEVYSGKFKRSLRLDGLSSTNSRLRERAIVVHGWDWVVEEPVIQGRTQGCPALDWKVKDAVIDKIKDGALINLGLSR
jgi:hypothetical protein